MDDSGAGIWLFSDRCLYHVNIHDESRPKFQEWATKRFISLLPENCIGFLQNVFLLCNIFAIARRNA